MPLLSGFRQSFSRSRIRACTTFLRSKIPATAASSDGAPALAEARPRGLSTRACRRNCFIFGCDEGRPHARSVRWCCPGPRCSFGPPARSCRMAYLLCEADPGWLGFRTGATDRSRQQHHFWLTCSCRRGHLPCAATYMRRELRARSNFQLERTACTGRRSAACGLSTPRRPVKAAVQRQR